MDVDALDAGRDAAHPTDAGSSMPDAGLHENDGDIGVDAGGHDTGAKHDAESPVWGPLAVVQSILSSGVDSTTFPSATTPGTLLVAMVPLGSAPSGSGWRTLVADSNSDGMYIWPNNPGGLQAFALHGSDYSVILVEISGVPSDVVLDDEKDTGPADATVASLSLTGAPATTVGELELLYLDTASASSATVEGWTYLGTDGNTNYGWWRTASAGSVSVTADYTAACSGSLVFASLKAN